MADKPLPWFRAYPEAAFDPKFDVAAIQTGLHPMVVFGAWWKILCLAGSSPIRGALYVTLQKRYSNVDVTAMLRLSNDEAKLLIDTFIDLDMLSRDENDALVVTNWGKRQFDSDYSTERVKKSREKAKSEPCNGDVTLQDCYSNTHVTPPDTDTDTDKDSSASDEKIPEGVKNPAAWRALKKHEERRNNGGVDLAQFPEMIRPLAEAFVLATDIMPVGRERGYWIRCLQEQWESGIPPDAIKRAVQKMRREGLTIKDPGSVTAIARDMNAKKKDKGEVWNEVHK